MTTYSEIASDNSTYSDRVNLSITPQANTIVQIYVGKGDVGSYQSVSGVGTWTVKANTTNSSGGGDRRQVLLEQEFGASPPAAGTVTVIFTGSTGIAATAIEFDDLDGLTTSDLFEQFNDDPDQADYVDNGVGFVVDGSLPSSFVSGNSAGLFASSVSGGFVGSVSVNEAGYARVGSASGVGMVIADGVEDLTPSCLVNAPYTVQPCLAFELNETGPGGGGGSSFYPYIFNSSNVIL